jgi:nucleoside-diphosphate-sugar epimerase
MSARQELHVVFGAGQIGPFLARLLLVAGKKVRLVRRSAAPVSLEGTETVRADAGDAAAVAKAVRGATAVYHCMNPAYSAAVWAADLPRIQTNLVTACGKEGARLIVLDNVYALGRPGGKPLSEATPLAPCSRKGEIRARVHRDLEDAVRRGDVRAVTGRASDFYGPGGVWTQFADRFWKPAFAGKRVAMLPNLDQPHTYHYIPDVAAGLAALGQDAGAEGTFMLPCRPAVTTRELVARLAAALGRPIAVSRLSPLLVSLLALGMPILREMKEMAYQWEEPFVIDDSRFRARYGDLSTLEEEAARATLEWAKATYSAGAGEAS